MVQSCRFIYFDLGNVLLFFSHRRAAAQLAELAVGADAEAVWQFAFASDLNTRCDAGEVSAAEFCRLFRARFECRADDDAIRHAASDIFEANAPMIETVSRLKRSGHRIGLLSNTCDMHIEWLEGERRFSPIPGIFDVAAYSFRERMTKPSVALYRRAARLAGVQPREVFYVDDLEANVLGAQVAGFDAVQYTTPEAFRAALDERGIKLR